ncbi:MAG: FtsX-like permease family protein [Acidimicrobiales bacterium]
MKQTLGVIGYRFRSTFERRWGGYLSIVILIGLLGGVAMGAVAAGRRTQSSFPTYLASTNPSDMSLGTALYNPALGQKRGYNASLNHRIAELPGVNRLESFIELYAVPLGHSGQPINTNVSVNMFGSVNGQYFDQDRVTVTQGRMADPRRADEFVMTAGAARAFGWRVGEVRPLGIYSLAQISSSSQPTVPYLRIDMKLVGIVVFNDAVVLDDVDALAAQNALFTPSLTDRLTACCADFSFAYLKLDGGSAAVPMVESEIEKIFPTALPFDPHATSLVVAKAERAIRPESLALGVFGLIAALAMFLVVAQVIARQLKAYGDDLETLRALGANPTMAVGDAVIGILGAIVVGALVAVAVAVALSPIAPIGPVRAVYPSRGFAFDWTVLGLGFAATALGFIVFAIALGYRDAPHRIARRSNQSRGAQSRLALASARAGLPPSAVTGIRFALEPGTGRTAVPVRSAIGGAALAVVVLIATITFGASLSALVSHPSLYGWNWNFELSGGGGVGDIPENRSATLLNDDRDVSAWSGAYFANLQVDGQSVPVLGEAPNAVVEPPVLSGHGLQASNQVVLGATTMAALHKRLGETVSVRYGSDPPTRLVIVGTATLPTTGISGVNVNHLSMGTGAILTYTLIPASVRNSFGNSPTGPNAIFVRLKSTVRLASAVRLLNRMAAALNLPTNYGVSLLSVQRPAEIVNYRSTGTTPALLAAGVAVGAVSALVLTLIASVRRRRRDLALLKTLGFTGRQLATTVAWQSSIAVAIGTVVGIPIGIVLGRFLWDQFAHEINAVPAPTVPSLSIALIAIGALLLANIVAALPGRVAARTPTALVLRVE